jgi:hypothetical protein
MDSLENRERIAACLGPSKQMRGLLSRVHSREPMRFVLNGVTVKSRRLLQLSVAGLSVSVADRRPQGMQRRALQAVGGVHADPPHARRPARLHPVPNRRKRQQYHHLRVRRQVEWRYSLASLWLLFGFSVASPYLAPLCSRGRVRVCRRGGAGRPADARSTQTCCPDAPPHPLRGVQAPLRDPRQVLRVLVLLSSLL